MSLSNKRTPIYKVLYFQVVCAIVIGIVLVPKLNKKKD